MPVRRCDDQNYTLATNGAGLTAPTQNAPSTATTGGTLAAATYFAKITAINANGETIASNEQSQITTGATSTVTWNWAAVTGAAGYKVYVGTATNAENTVITVGTVTSYTQTATLTTSGTPPTSGTSATGPSVAIKGGEYMFTVEGSIGGATVTLQMQSANGTWITVQAFAGGAAVSMTALPEAISWIPLPECNVRMGVSGGAPSGLFAYLHGLG